MKLYETLAAEFADSIDSGILSPGDRLPSVRQVRASRNVSASTVFQAYYLLEARGLIRARERSGYFVLGRKNPPPPELVVTSSPNEDAATLNVCELIFEVIELAKNRDIVPLGSAFPGPLLFPLPRLAKAMCSVVHKLDPWASIDDLTPGHPGLRQEIARRYLADGCHVKAEDIVVTNGGLEALNLCLQAVTRPGDSVIIESPSFYAALQAIERLGLQAVEVPTHACEGIELAALEAAIQRHSPKACWLMMNFQNPLGCLMGDEKKKALVELLARYNVPLIEDDVYGELYFGAKRPVPAKAFDTQGLVMHCGSFSKCLAPGYRIGWAAPGRHTQSVARLKLMTTISTSAPAQEAIRSYLQTGGYDRHLRRLRHTLECQQGLLMQAIARHFPSGTRVTRPQGGYFLWVELPDGTDTLALHRKALTQGISIAPGPIFSAKQEFKNCMRLNYGHAWNEATEKALKTLGELMQ